MTYQKIAQPLLILACGLLLPLGLAAAPAPLGRAGADPASTASAPTTVRLSPGYGKSAI